MANDIINPDAISSGAMTFFSSAGDTIMWIILIALLGLLIWLVWWIMSYKIKVIVRQKISDGRTLIKIDKGKIQKDRNGVYWLKLFKHRIKLPEPDNENFDITTKGKKIIEFIKIGTDFVPILIKSRTVDSTNSFSPAQRQMMIHECRESEQYKKRTAMDLLRDAIPYMALVLIILGLLIFMPDIIESKTQVVNAYNGVADKLDTVADKLVVAGCTQPPPKELPKEPPN